MRLDWIVQTYAVSIVLKVAGFNAKIDERVLYRRYDRGQLPLQEVAIVMLCI
jgi:hypothetical protein